MATYAPRPDGLYEVTLDDGRIVPTAMDPATLEAQGFMPQVQAPDMPVLPDERTAGLDTASLNTRPGLPGSEALGASPAFGQLMGTGQQRLDAPPAPMGPPAPPPVPAQNMSAMPPAGMSVEPPRAGGPSNLERVPGTNETSTSKEAPRVLSDADIATRDFLKGEMAPRPSGPLTRIPAHDVRSAYTLKYKATPENPELDEAIGESRIDQQLARQEGSEQLEYAKAMQARVAAQNASQAQRELERTLVRKNAIDQEVGRRVQAIDARLERARALTESGSARDRVMKNKGAFGRVLSVIGLALGDFAAMASKTGLNPARDQLNKEIDEEAEREKKLYDVSPEESALKAYVDAWGTPQKAMEEYKLGLQTSMLTKLDAWARRADAEQVPIEFRNWLADQALGVQQQKQALQQDAAADVVEQFQRVPEKVVGGGPARPDPLKAMERTAKFREAYEKATGQSTKDMKQSDLEQIYSRSVRLPSGETVYAPDQKRAQEIQQKVDAVNQIHQNIRDIRDIMKKPASEVNLADRERLKAAVQSNKTLGKEAETLGAISKSDVELIGPLSGEAALDRLNPMKPDVAILAGLDAAEKHFARRVAGAQRSLYRDPNLRKPVVGAPASSFKERE